MSSISLKTDLHPFSHSYHNSFKWIWFSFSKSTSFIIFFFFHASFKSCLVIQLNVLLLMSKSFFLADIHGSSTSFSWRRLFFPVYVLSSCDLIDLCLDLNFILQSCTLTLFQMDILVGETISRKRCSKSCWTSLKPLVFK